MISLPVGNWIVFYSFVIDHEIPFAYEGPLCANRGHSFSGHSLKDFEAILDAHYLGRDVQVAEGRQSAISINTGW